ncbi:hypothetical protein Zmor_008134 [Zophobas morio]|uniref:Uncharacterized protein n=1 Tax=Zophobas morio TaxID=2755281 RepID=A0AA38IUX8_9CUCU|nr:hypothetical protein Zmor_008134 [Zophobas morio]
MRCVLHFANDSKQFKITASQAPENPSLPNMSFLARFVIRSLPPHAIFRRLRTCLIYRPKHTQANIGFKRFIYEYKPIFVTVDVIHIHYEELTHFDHWTLQRISEQSSCTS